MKALLIVLAACSSVSDYGFNLRAPVSPASFESALYQLLHVRFTDGNDVTLCNDAAVFDCVEQEVAQAQRNVHVLGYIWEKGRASDRVVSALNAAAARGVACRIVVDDFGSPKFKEDIAPALKGCEVHLFRPLDEGDKLPRNHRKLVIVDGQSAILGGFGIRDDWLTTWRDSNVRVRGPVVADIQQSYAESWLTAGGKLLPDDAFPPLAKRGTMRATYIVSTGSFATSAEKWTQVAFASAAKRLWVANAYFVPSSRDRELLQDRARAGVDVRILAAGKLSDSKVSYVAQQPQYGMLAKHGVRIWEYGSSMMHAKTMVIDDALTFIGSNNLDPLSLKYLDDLVLVVHDKGFAQEMAARYEQDLTKSTPR